MQLGVSLGNFSWPGPVSGISKRVGQVARFADEAGFDSLWVMDHFFQIRITGAPPEDPMLEAYATLGFLAAQTSHIRLGASVTSVAYRHPGVLIKAATTLDVLSGGRFTLGVGAGMPWNGLPPGVAPRDVETTGLGIPMPSLAERFERLEELLQIACQMWSGGDAPYEGRHYQMARPLNSPPSLQQPHPPILIGGSGERKTLRLVARYGDACNLFDLPGTGFKDDLGHKLDVLRAHCAEAGRDYNEIEKTASTILDLESDPAAGLAAFVEHLGELASLGIDHVFVGLRRQPWDRASLEVFASAIPEIHAIPSRG